MANRPILRDWYTNPDVFTERVTSAIEGDKVVKSEEDATEFEPVRGTSDAETDWMRRVMAASEGDTIEGRLQVAQQEAQKEAAKQEASVRKWEKENRDTQDNWTNYDDFTFKDRE